LFSASSKNIRYPIENFVFYENLAHSFKHFICSIDRNKEPNTFEEAIKNSDWRAVMNDEISGLNRNHTWTLTTLPNSKTVIGCKWIYKIKYEADESTYRCKGVY